MGENKIHEAFDGIHAEQELKDNTKEFLNDYYKKEKRAWNFNIYKVVVPVLTALVILVAGVTVRSQTVEAARIDLKNGPEISLSVNRWNKVIQAEGLNDEANQVLESLDLEGMNYTDAVEKILEDESYWQDTAESQIEVEVTCKNNQLGEEIQQEVTTQCEQHQEQHQYEKHQYGQGNEEHNSEDSSNCQNQENQTEEIQENCEENTGNAQGNGETQGQQGNSQGLHDGSGNQNGNQGGNQGHGHNNTESHE